MNKGAHETDLDGGHPGHPAGRLGRAIALIEVVLAIALVHVANRAFKHFTAPGR